MLAFAEARHLDTKALTSLCQVVRRGDEDEVQRLMARLRREQSRPRATPSWYALLYAVPADFAPRLAALEAELAALPEPARAARLDEVRQQVNRMAGALEGLQGILTRGAPRADTDDGRHPRPA